MKKLFKKIFHKRISKLYPVVALDEHAKLIYGRYDYYDSNRDDDLCHNVLNIEDDMFIECFAVRKITEEQLIEYMKLVKK